MQHDPVKTTLFPSLDVYALLEKTKKKRVVKLKATGCEACKLNLHCRTPKMKGEGLTDTKIMIIGEAPGEMEDRRGVPFVGAAGRLLRTTLTDLNIDPGTIFMTNTIKCRPLSESKTNRTPTPKEILCCLPFLEQEIKEVKPEIIVLTGNIPLSALTGSDEITKYRGNFIPSEKYNTILLPIFHPAAVLRDVDKYKFNFEHDLELLKSYKPVSFYDLNTYVNAHSILSTTDLPNFIETLANYDKLSIDIETKLLKPFDTLSKILIVAIATSGKMSYSFEVNKETVPFLIKILDMNHIKIFHHWKFEYTWFKYKLGYDCGIDKIWDTMLFAYLINETKGTHSLDFLSRVKLGLHKLSEVDKYKEDMEQCPKDLLHKYCGLDTKLTFRLAEYFVPMMTEKMWDVYNKFLIAGSKVCAKSEIEGVVFDENERNRLEDEYVIKISSIIKHIYSLPKVKRWKEEHEFNLNSSKDIREFIYEGLKLPKTKTTDTKQLSVDAGVLKSFSSEPFCRDLLEYRDLVKVSSTYIKGLKRAISPVTKRIHTNYNLIGTETGRLASDSPNLQNVDHHKHPEIRRMFTAPKGMLLMSLDYSSAEIRGASMVTLDNYLSADIKNGIDIHGLFAVQLFGVSKQHANWDSYRYRCKNGFIFPRIYGASINSIAKNLSLSLSHVTDCVKAFDERYPGIPYYHKQIMQFYREHGYIETWFGRRRHAPLTYTQIINFPIQSLMSDFTLLSMIRATNAGYIISLNIHDDLALYVPDDCIITVYKEMKKIMTDWNFHFMSVPLEVECKVGENWGEMYPIEDIVNLGEEL